MFELLEETRKMKIKEYFKKKIKKYFGLKKAKIEIEAISIHIGCANRIFVKGDVDNALVCYGDAFRMLDGFDYQGHSKRINWKISKLRGSPAARV